MRPTLRELRDAGYRVILSRPDLPGGWDYAVKRTSDGKTILNGWSAGTTKDAQKSALDHAGEVLTVGIDGRVVPS